MRIKGKVSMVAVAILAIVMIASIGGYAYWSVQQLTANTIASGHMAIEVYDGVGSAAQSLNVAGLMPGDSNVASPTMYQVKSADGNPNVDLGFSVSNVADVVSLADNVELAFLLCTGNPYAYWLTPSGAMRDDSGTISESYWFDASAYNGVSWTNLDGFKGIAETDIRHIKVYYRLPVDCANDCHDDTLTFDMTFELMQSH